MKYQGTAASPYYQANINIQKSLLVLDLLLTHLIISEL